MDAKRSCERIWRAPLAEVGAVLLLTGIAALLRVVAIDTLPPGLYRDEAYNGLDALQVLSGQWPLFFEANNGREPLFIYLLAPAIRLWGRSPGALRIVSAGIGTLTIPIIYWLARELFDCRVAMLAAILAATTVWTLNLSRVVFRAVLMVPLLALALACLWRGLHQRRGFLMVLAGICYGLSLYTYLAARFGVLSLFFFITYTWLWHRESFWLQGWGFFAVSSLLTFAPLGLYFLEHWESVLGRAGEVSILNPAISGGAPVATLLRHLWRTLRGFAYRGDFIPRHNVPLRAVFDPLMSMAFFGGLALAVARARRNAAYGLCLIWWGTMLLPTILAEDAPHMLRAAGILPLLFVFPALGLAEFAHLAARRGWRLGGQALVAMVVCVSAGSNLLAYARHLGSETVYYHFEAGAAELAATANRFTGSGWRGQGLAVVARAPIEGREVFFAPRLWRDWPSVRFLCPPSEALHTLDEDPGPLMAKASEVLLLLWPYEDNRRALALLPRGKLIRVRQGAQERGDLEQESRLLYIAVYAQPTDAVPRNVLADWERGIRLLGYRLSPAGDSALQITLYWRTQAPLEQSYTVFVHVLEDGQLIGQHDGPVADGYYPTSQWRVGDVVADRHLVRLSQPYQGREKVSVGLYLWPTMEHLVLLDASGARTSQASLMLGE